MGFNPNRKNEIAANIARVMAIEQYFFWVSLICSIVTVLVFKYFHDLTVNHHAAADNAENREDAYKQSLDSKPFINLKGTKAELADKICELVLSLTKEEGS